MPRATNELLHGTLEVMILKALRDEPRHGYEIARHIRTSTEDAVVVEDGSLYPALYRLEAKKLLRGEWGVSAGRRARFYRLTPAGQRRLQAETEKWSAFAKGVSKLLLGPE
jgi:PadR family transcriptional regulator, regulatory protein PadR